VRQRRKETRRNGGLSLGGRKVHPEWHNTQHENVHFFHHVNRLNQIYIYERSHCRATRRSMPRYAAPGCSGHLISLEEEEEERDLINDK